MMDFRIPRAVRESGHAPERSMFDDRFALSHYSAYPDPEKLFSSYAENTRFFNLEK